MFLNVINALILSHQQLIIDSLNKVEISKAIPIPNGCFQPTNLFQPMVTLQCALCSVHGCKIQ